MIELRYYKKGDAEKIYHLFTKYTSYERNADFWVWINRLVYDEPSIISVATVNSEIVGHYAVVPQKINLINGLSLRGALGIHAFVAPEFRNQVSIFSLSSLVYQQAKLEGIDLIYGFPNSNYRLIQEKIERWSKISLFNSFVKFIKPENYVQTRYNWIEVVNPDGDDLLSLENLLSDVSFGLNCLHKTLRYYQNRYFNHPQKPYRHWFLSVNDDIIAFVVTKRYENNETVFFHIIDVLFSKGCDFHLILSDFEKFICREPSFSVQWPISSDIKYVLQKFGYKESGHDTFFGVKFLSDLALSHKSEILDFDNWRLLMGDSDAY